MTARSSEFARPAKPLLSLRTQAALGRIAGYVAMILLCAIIGAPLFWMLTGAFKARQEITTFPPIWWPEALRWSSWADVENAWVNFREAWDEAPFERFYLNSIIITVVGMTLEVINATLSAYALAFLRFRYKNLVFILILAALMVPAQVTVLPNYIFLGKTMPALGLPNWVNTYQGIILPGAAVAYGTFLLRQAFMGLPREVLDAAKVDGAGHLRTLWDMVLPMSRPVLVTFALISMVAKWNDYLWPLIVTNEERMRPITVGIANFFDNEGNTNWGVVMAGTIYVVAPLLIVYLWAQRHIIEGITAGATKG
jgi:ABC-type glycerol-3-phosphate transport system permease component